MANNGTHSERVAAKLVEYLFNQKVLSLPQVSPAKIAEVAGDAAPVVKDGKLKYKSFSRITVWRWLKALGLDEKSIKDGVEPLDSAEVSAFLVGNLSFEQAENLYEWARAERFDAQKPAKRTTAKGKAKRQTRAKAVEAGKADAALLKETLTQTAHTNTGFLTGKSGAPAEASAPKPVQPAKRTFPEVATSYGPTGKILNKGEVGTNGLAKAVKEGIITKEERKALVFDLASSKPLQTAAERYGLAVLMADTANFREKRDAAFWAYHKVLGYLSKSEREELEQAKKGQKAAKSATIAALAKAYQNDWR